MNNPLVTDTFMFESVIEESFEKESDLVTLKTFIYTYEFIVFGPVIVNCHLLNEYLNDYGIFGAYADFYHDDKRLTIKTRRFIPVEDLMSFLSSDPTKFIK